MDETTATTTSTRDAALRAASALVARTRREAATASLECFARLYLTRRFDLPCAPMHRELFAALEEATAQRDARLAVAVPAGHGASTIAAYAFPLWAVCCRGERYVSIALRTQEEARERLHDIALELGGNAALRRDFPGAAGRPGRLDEVRTRDGARIVGVAAQRNVLGGARVGSGPGVSLLIVDDAERNKRPWSLDSDDHAQARWNEERYPRVISGRDLDEWLQRALRRRLAPGGNVVVIGAIPRHHNTLLPQLLDRGVRPEWRKLAFKAILAEPPMAETEELWRRYNYLRRSGLQGADGPAAFLDANRAAMTDGACVAWPERFDYPALRALRADDVEAFRSLMQSDPMSDRLNLDDERRFRPCGDRYVVSTAEAHRVLSDEGHEVRVGVLRALAGGEPEPGWPEIALVRTDRETGERRAMDYYTNRRRIHGPTREQLREYAVEWLAHERVNAGGATQPTPR